VVTGTPQTMAPEAIRSPHDVDGRADIYALGAVAYFMLTGRDVFEGDSVVEVCAHHIHTEPVRPSVRRGEAIPASLEQLVLRCLAKDPAARPQSAQEIVAFLHRLRHYGDLSWSDEQARAWWSARSGPSPRRLSPTVETPRTIRVCVERTPPTVRAKPTFQTLTALAD